MKLKENKEGCMAGFEGRTEKGKYYNYILNLKEKKEVNVRENKTNT